MRCKTILFRLTLLFVAYGLALTYAQSQPIMGAAVQNSHYDSTRGTVTFDVLNTSSKAITGFFLLVRITRLDGTTGTIQFGNNCFPTDSQGSGCLAPGAVFHLDVPVGQQPVQEATATVDLVVYADDTANVLNKQALETIISQRRDYAAGLQKADQLLEEVLADPNDAHPSITAAAKLKALAKQYEAGGGFEGMGLLAAATNVSNAPKSPFGRSQKEDAWLRELIKTHQATIPSVLAHSRLVKGVQP